MASHDKHLAAALLAHSLLDGGLVEQLTADVMAKVRSKIAAEIGLLKIDSLTRLPGGGATAKGVELDGPEDRVLLDGILNGLEPPAGVVKQINNVDLRAQFDTYLSEKSRSDDAIVGVRRTLGWYMDVTEKAGLPPDSKQAATLFKKWLQERDIIPRTVNIHLGRVSQFLRWATAHGYVSGDPVGAVKLPPNNDKKAQSEQREAVPIAALRSFLGTGAGDVQLDDRAWLPWILAYTGARINEIASLYVDNIQQDKASGVWFIEIDTKYPGQAIKNPESRRRVPIHQHLLDLGLLDHVNALREAGVPRLFKFWSIVRPGKHAGAWLRPLLKHDAHSIRHRVATDLANAGLDEPVVNRLLGHSAFQSMLKTYFKGHEITKLAEAIAVLDYSGRDVAASKAYVCE